MGVLPRLDYYIYHAELVMSTPILFIFDS